MRVLFLALDVRLEIPRGDAIHTLEFARSLGSLGHRLTMVTATPDERVPDLGPNVRHHRRPEGSDLRVALWCLRLAKAGGVDVVYERRLSPKIAWAVSLLARLPFVVEVNGVEEEARILGVTTARRWLTVRRAVRRRMYLRAARVIAVSDGLAALVRQEQRVKHDRVVTIPNAVDPVAFAPVEASHARTALSLADAPWIVYVGNLVPWQGVETLLRAFADSAIDPRARLAVVGDGISRPSLVDAARRLGLAHRVLFTGAVPHEKVPLYIGASNVCVAPFTRNRNELVGLSPLKLFEYMACGRPVVASDLPGIREVLSASGGGIVVAPDRPPELARAVAHLLDHPEEARSMGSRGRSYVLANATWSSTARRIEDVLNQIRDTGR